MDAYRHYINGKWTPSGDQATFDVRNPYNDSLHARAAAGTAARSSSPSDRLSHDVPG